MISLVRSNGPKFVDIINFILPHSAASWIFSWTENLSKFQLARWSLREAGLCGTPSQRLAARPIRLNHAEADIQAHS